MNRGALIILGMTIGSVVGGFVPMLWGDGMMSYSSVLTSSIGAIAGIFLVYKVTS